MTNRVIPWRGPAAAFLAVCMLSAAAGVLLAAEASGKSDRKKARPVLKVGEPAPDFELPLLTEEENEDGEKVFRISDEKVKLSSFRGEKVVCVFMSSYT